MNKPTTKESLPNNSPKESTKSMNKPSTKEPLPKASPSPTPNPPGILTIYDVKATRSSISGLISALDEVLGGHTVVFKLQLSPNSNDYYNKLLKEKPYQAISEIIRSDKFNEAFLSALRVKWSAIYEKTTDLRSKPLSIRIEKKLLKSEFVDKLISLLTWQGRKKQLSVTDASRLVYDLLDPIFSVKPEDNKYVTYLEEKISSEVGSQGNLKSEGSTLADFIVAPKKQQKKKKKTKKVTQEENEEKKEVPIPQEQPKTLIVSKEEQNVESDKFDPIYNPATISKSIPYGWQFGVLTKNLLKKKSIEGNVELSRHEYYFTGFSEEIDNALTFWNNSDVVFFFSTGSE